MPDPFTTRVIQAGLDAAAREMFEVLCKTATSPIIHEVFDVGTGVTDAAKRLVSSEAGILLSRSPLNRIIQDDRVSAKGYCSERTRDVEALDDYASTSEAIRDAVREWRERRNLLGYTADELRELDREGIGSGPMPRHRNLNR